jgi:hypothetical protein
VDHQGAEATRQGQPSVVGVADRLDETRRVQVAVRFCGLGVRGLRGGLVAPDGGNKNKDERYIGRSEIAKHNGLLC